MQLKMNEVIILPFQVVNKWYTNSLLNETMLFTYVIYSQIRGYTGIAEH